MGKVTSLNTERLFTRFSRALRYGRSQGTPVNHQTEERAQDLMTQLQHDAPGLGRVADVNVGEGGSIAFMFALPAVFVELLVRDDEPIAVFIEDRTAGTESEEWFESVPEVVKHLAQLGAA